MARSFSILVFLLLLTGISVTDVQAQSNSRSYELIPAPDLWYNDVDGIRAGIRVKGQVPGTFEDGPHRLDAGLWVGLWFPDLPVSYYLSYTQPISDWSDFGSEASFQGISSIRTGYSMHGVGFNKRWQQGFDERRYREISLFNTYEKRIDNEYTAFPALWSTDHKVLTKLRAELQDDNRLGWYSLALNGAVQYLDETYGTASLTAIQRIPFNDSWGLRLRGFIGTSSSSTAPEYLFSRSMGQQINTIQHGVTRAKGTIPQPWIESGRFHIAGGANLRGYTRADVESFTGDGGINDLPSPVLSRSIAALNAEFDYPNPLKRVFEGIPYVAEFINFRSYLFFDTGSQFLDNGNSGLVSDAGAGFALSLNIPDYLGKPRGFVLRYEIPFWVSDTIDEDSFKFRSLFGFGAVISF